MAANHTAIAPLQPAPVTLNEDVIRYIVELAHAADEEPPRVLLSLRLLCRCINQFIMSSPWLWTRFQLRHDLNVPFDDRVAALHQAMRRSQDRPLEVALTVTDMGAFRVESPPIQAARKLLASPTINARLRCLDLEIPPMELLSVYKSLGSVDQVAFPQLTGLSVELSRRFYQESSQAVLQSFRLRTFMRHSPMLQTLWLCSPTHIQVADQPSIPWSQLTEFILQDNPSHTFQRSFVPLLISSVQLRVCNLTLAGWATRWDIPAVTNPVRLGELSSLTITATGGAYLRPFFDPFIMPNLQTLSVSFAPEVGYGKRLCETLALCDQRSNFNLRHFAMTRVKCSIWLVPLLRENPVQELSMRYCLLDHDAVDAVLDELLTLVDRDVHFTYCPPRSHKREREDDAPVLSEPDHRLTKRRRLRGAYRH